MAFGIIRVRKLHIKDLKGAQKHNNREFAPDELPDNINPKGEYLHSSNGKETIEDAVMERIKGVPLRKDSVVAIEYVCAISKETMEKLSYDHDQRSILQFLGSFVYDKHGIENVVSYSLHQDEDNPHIHLVAVPLIEKTVKWKNTKGQGEKTENRLCARDFIGGKDMLRQLQTDYHNHVTTSSKYWSKVWELKKIDFWRGRDARANKKYYSKMTNHVVGKALTEFYEAQKLHKEKMMSTEQYNEIEKATEIKIKAISDNMEKKIDKDQKLHISSPKWKDKWNQNTPDFGI